MPIGAFVSECQDFIYDWGNWFDMFLVTASLGDVRLGSEVLLMKVRGC